MAGFVIQVFPKAEEELEAMIKVPVTFIKTGSQVIPRKVAAALSKRGVDVREVFCIHRRRRGAGYLSGGQGPRGKVVLSVE